MSGALIIGLIVVVWLFVLAPLVLRGYRPIRRTNEAFEETRVVVAGGQAPAVSPRKRPHFSAADVQKRKEFHTGAGDLTQDTSSDEAAEQLIDDPAPHFVTEKISDVLTAAQEKVAQEKVAQEKAAQEQAAESVEVAEPTTAAAMRAAVPSAETTMELETTVQVEAAVELDTPVELPYSDVVDENVLFMEDIDSPPITGSFAVPVVDKNEPYPYDDAYASPADFLDPDADYEFAEDFVEGEYGDYADESGMVAEYADGDLTEEDLEFAARRRGRGGYDPEVEAAVAMSRYQRRQRTLATLGGLGLLSLGVGVLLGGWFWVATALVVGLTALYLYALRRQVRAEHELRAQRIRHMRRARLGVRNAVDEKLGIPERLRRPGAIVIEVDDESPDFVNLDTVRSRFGHDEPEVWEDEYVDSRQVG